MPLQRFCQTVSHGAGVVAVASFILLTNAAFQAELQTDVVSATEILLLSAAMIALATMALSGMYSLAATHGRLDLLRTPLRINLLSWLLALAAMAAILGSLCWYGTAMPDRRVMWFLSGQAGISAILLLNIATLLSDGLQKSDASG